MRRNFTALAAAAWLAACNTGDAEADKAEPAYVKAHDIQQLMATVVQPQADVYWKSAGTVSNETGMHDLTPTTDEGWLRTQSAAATVAEMGNLLQTPLYAEGRGEDWIQFSRSLVEIGMQAEKAAKARNGDAVLDVGGTMYNVCTACHQVYPPAAGEAPVNANAASNQARP